jgi:hypothetical protein
VGYGVDDAIFLKSIIDYIGFISNLKFFIDLNKQLLVELCKQLQYSNTFKQKYFFCNDKLQKYFFLFIDQILFKKYFIKFDCVIKI